MKPFSLLPILLPVLLLAGACASAPRPYAPTRSFDYGARGHDPFWLVTIGDEAIVLTRGQAGGAADGALATAFFPRVLPVEQPGVRRWESGEGTAVIAIEARPGPCLLDGRSYADRVSVFLSGSKLDGCGGRELAGRG